jgi:GTP cyclohydrolase I
MIILKDIDFESLCSHHLLPFTGKVHIGYVPLGTICGISKLARAVDKFSHKPQLQEKFTQELIVYLNNQLAPKGIMIVVEAQHACMTCRGPKKKNAVMITSAIEGIFRQQEVRQEFLNLIKGG